MIAEIGEPFVNFDLMKDVGKAEKDGVIHLNVPLNNEYEESHLSELERLMRPLDEVETYVVTKTLVKYHKDTFVNTLEYMNKGAEEK